MTEKNKALLDQLFRRFGSPSDDGEIRIHSYLRRADQLNDTKTIQHYDKSASQGIENLQRAIETLTAYRLSLAERYNFVATSPTVPVVRLQRRRDPYKDKVFYYLRTLRRRVSDGAETQESQTVYPGTERRKALADFDAYVKAHPGIIAEKNIDCSRR